ncbi:hypothetical protein [Adlercreutzia sp. ZJ242]|uniref:hypothetical protein n=1 Tax=Adlercreutzia sp. ZJ242 TaxID=2709409 RepID=UPI0013EDBCA2|nr:hypothetical protein [Adlercreutzia sp. ZJ242]
MLHQRRVSTTAHDDLPSPSLSEAEFHAASPADYLLFQAADLACTMEPIEAKRQEGGLGRSECTFFGGTKRVKKAHLKALRRQDF